MTGLWRGFNERMERILAARASVHASITSTMPDGIMGRDFARNFLKVLKSPCIPGRQSFVHVVSGKIRGWAVEALQHDQSLEEQALCKMSARAYTGSTVHLRRRYSFYVQSTLPLIFRQLTALSHAGA